MSEANSTTQPPLPPRPMAEVEKPRGERLHWIAIPLSLGVGVLASGWLNRDVITHGHGVLLRFDMGRLLAHATWLVPAVCCMVITDHLTRGRWRRIAWPLAAGASAITPLSILLLHHPAAWAHPVNPLTRAYFQRAVIYGTLLPSLTVLPVVALVSAVAARWRGGEIPGVLAIILIIDLASKGALWAMGPRVSRWVNPDSFVTQFALFPALLLRPLTLGIGLPLGVSLWLSRRQSSTAAPRAPARAWPALAAVTVLLVAGDAIICRPVRDLEHAIKSGDTARVKSLLDSGVNPNRTTDFRRQRPLQLALVAPSVPLTELLLAAGADPRLEGFAGETAIETAAQYNWGAIALLLRYGADATTSMHSGVPILWHCVEHGHVRAVEALIEHGAHPLFVNTKGQTLLWPAVWSGKPELVDLLVGKGVDPFHRDQRGDTARDYARQRRIPKVGTALLRAELAAAEHAPPV